MNLFLTFSLLASGPYAFTISKLSKSAPAATVEPISVPVIVALMVTFIIAIVLLSAFWTLDSQDKSRRQRRYARVDDLYFPIQAAIITKEFIEELRAMNGDQERIERYFMTFLPIDLRVTSISLGGCAIKAERPLEKGQLLLCNLAHLPDYPSKHSYVSFKVAWIRNPKNRERDGRIDIGLQLAETFQHDAQDTLRKYLNYLLDDPAA